MKYMPYNINDSHKILLYNATGNNFGLMMLCFSFFEKWFDHTYTFVNSQITCSLMLMLRSESLGWIGLKRDHIFSSHFY